MWWRMLRFVRAIAALVHGMPSRDERRRRIEVHAKENGRWWALVCLIVGGTTYFVTVLALPPMLSLALIIVCAAGAVWFVLGWEGVRDAIKIAESSPLPQSSTPSRPPWAKRRARSFTVALVAVTAMSLVGWVQLHPSGQNNSAAPGDIGGNTGGGLADAAGKVMRGATGLTVGVNAWSGCGVNDVYELPSTINPTTESGRERIGQAWLKASRGVATLWPISVPVGQTYHVSLSLTSGVQGNQHMEVSNKVRVSFRKRQLLPRQEIILQFLGCGTGGGGGPGQSGQAASDFVFAPIVLDETASGNTVESSYKGADYFDLPPGGSVVFSIPFSCKEPGIYHAKLGFPYTLTQETAIASVDWEPLIACSQLHPAWSVDSTLLVHQVQTS